MATHITLSQTERTYFNPKRFEMELQIWDSMALRRQEAAISGMAF